MGTKIVILLKWPLVIKREFPSQEACSVAPFTLDKHHRNHNDA
jgi:hypothetical protein